MKHSDDKRRLFFDMQEHPENYSDEALEQMMAELDRETDAEAAWRRMTERCDSPEAEGRKTFIGEGIRRIAASFIAVAFLGLMSLAGYRVFSDWQGKPQDTAEDDTTTAVKQRFYYDVQDGDTIFRFENIRLDSILAVVSRHYNRQVVFHNTRHRGLRLYITCHTTETLDEFVETLNMFDGLLIVQDFDTLHVATDEGKEGTR